MLIPLLLWAATGVVFLTKPGYGGAYLQLEPKRYEIEREVRLPEASHWKQVKILRTILGYHLIVSNDGRWTHLDPFTLIERPYPTESEMEVLIDDAISTDKDRFGNIVEIEENIVTTDTDIQITLDWHTLTLQQSGRDTRLINTLYKIHYLQWTGSPAFDKMFGVIGLVGLVVLTIFGLAAYAKKSGSNGT